MSGCNNGLPNCITPLPMDASGKMSDYEFLCNLSNKMNVIISYLNKININISDLFVTPQQYGAVADGVTDDSEAFQKCADLGTNILIPPGRYYINKTIICSDNTRFFGCGSNCTIINYNENINLFILANSNSFTDITINTNNGDNVAFYGNNVTGCTWIRVQNLGGSFFDTSSRFIKIVGNSWHTILIFNCLIDYGGVTGYAIDLSQNPTNPSLVNSDLHIQYCFIDALNANSSGGSIKLKDVYAASLEWNLLRGASSTVFYLTRTDPNGAGTCDAWLDYCSHRTGTTKVDAGCTLTTTGYQQTLRNYGQLKHWTGNIWQNIIAYENIINPNYITVSQSYLGTYNLTQSHSIGANTHNLAGISWDIGNNDTFQTYLQCVRRNVRNPLYGIGLVQNDGSIFVLGVMQNANGVVGIGAISYTSYTECNEPNMFYPCSVNDIYLRIAYSGSTLGLFTSSDGSSWYLMSLITSVTLETTTQFAIVMDNYLMDETNGEQMSVSVKEVRIS